jgi:hypothetical protein
MQRVNRTPYNKKYWQKNMKGWSWKSNFWIQSWNSEFVKRIKKEWPRTRWLSQVLSDRQIEERKKRLETLLPLICVLIKQKECKEAEQYTPCYTKHCRFSSNCFTRLDCLPWQWHIHEFVNKSCNCLHASVFAGRK